jgi:TolB-like protein
MRTKARRSQFLLSGVALILLVHCGGPRTFIHPDVDISYYEVVGVLPFKNLSSDRLAGEKITAVLTTELLMKKKFEVVEPGQFRRTAREILSGNIDSGGEWKPEEIRKLGESTGVKGIITGTVREYQMIRIGQTQYPLITIDAELIDVETGRVVWMISHSKKGGPNLPVLSVGETYTLGDLGQQVCKDVVDRIAD